MEKEFFELLTEISYGLVQKEKRYEELEKNENYEYFQQPELVASIQKLGLFMLANKIVDKNGFPLAPANESDAIVNYFSRPLCEWPTAKHSAFQPLLALGNEEDVLIHTFDDYTLFSATEWSQELSTICRLYNEDAMQKAVYLLLISSSPEQYCFLRRFIIEHPIVDNIRLLKFKRKGKEIGLDDSFINDFIQQAYEPLPSNVYGECEYCGWTILRNKHRKVCADFRCEAETDGYIKSKSIDHPSERLRLKLGVMKYMCIPGRDELALVKYCEQKQLTTTLWPDKDRYDLRIIKGSHTFAIDVKSYVSPYALKYHIEKNGVFNSLLEEERPILVIPNERIRKKGYLDIVKHGLPSEVECLSMRQLKAVLGKEN